ncbi:MAG: JAB domain-containing protein [Deltaproteobacteria bacterium]|nr:JAB domain-containing protein [Deltaproteobacteria bacterium]
MGRTMAAVQRMEADFGPTAQGAPASEAVELLDAWLRLAAPGLDRSRETAVQVLGWARGAARLLRIPPRVVAARWGLPAPAVECLRLAADLGALAAQSPRPLRKVTGSRGVFERFAHLARHPRETFWVLGLGCRNHVLSEDRVAEGSVNCCALLPRDVFGPAVAAFAVQAVLVHNHPSGDPTPSPEDVALTRRLAQAGDLLGVTVLDHVIVGAGTWRSLRDDGLLEVV